MIEWVIYYVDKKTFSNLAGKSKDAPGSGVLGIVILDDDTVGYRIVSGGGPYYAHGYYWWEKDTWFIGDRTGLDFYLATPGNKVVKFGQTVIKDEWQAFLKRVEADFGPKSSYWRGEPGNSAIPHTLSEIDFVRQT